MSASDIAFSIIDRARFCQAEAAYFSRCGCTAIAQRFIQPREVKS